MDDIYKIELSDGTVLDRLQLNGNNYVSSKEITEQMFRGKLRQVKITNGTQVQYLYNVELVQITQEGDEWWFIIQEIDATQYALSDLNAKVDYLAMMIDVEF